MNKVFNFEEKEYGLVGCGEMIMRLSPINNELLIQSTLLSRNIGGAEFNIASSVSNLGEKCSFITTLPANDLGKMATKSLAQNGVCTKYINYDSSKYQRMPIYYYEYGSSPRKPNVTYDRWNSSFQNMKIEDVNGEIYSKTKIFHTSGISLGLCENTKNLTIDLIKNFKANGALISFDVNFRRNLWSEPEARVEIEKILPYIDILFASEETFRKMFEKTGELKDIMKNFAKEYNISVIASTQRVVNSPKSHNFTSIIYDNINELYFTEKPYMNIEIVDRIGSGDAYVAGALFGILRYNSCEKAMEIGNANSVFKNTTVGDISCADEDIINSLIREHKSGSNSEMNR